MGYRFTVMDPNIDEKSIRNKNPKKLVVDIAYAKASVLLPKIKKPSILITTDTVVYCNNKIIEKPKDKKEAEKFLRLYIKYPAKTVTAILATNTINKKQKHGIDIATIWFHTIPKEIIKQLANQERVLTCAGGFYIDDPVLQKYVLKIDGTIESIIGLPIELTEKLIAEVST